MKLILDDTSEINNLIKNQINIDKINDSLHFELQCSTEIDTTFLFKLINENIKDTGIIDPVKIHGEIVTTEDPHNKSCDYDSLIDDYIDMGPINFHTIADRLENVINNKVKKVLIEYGIEL